MPFTAVSIALVWIATFAVVGLTITGATSGPWLVLAVLAALAAPALLRRTRPVPAVPLTINGKASALTNTRIDGGHTGDVLRWENEGGARRGLGVPLPATR
jgi:hypothetical protein